MTNNNPSQHQCCLDCWEGVEQVNNNPFTDLCANKDCPCHTVSQSDLKEALESVDKQIGGAARALGSQYEEYIDEDTGHLMNQSEWEKESMYELECEMHNLTYYDKASGSRYIDEEYVRKVILRILTDSRSTTLSTLVKEMEGLKGCRFGCFCPLCQLCDVDTSIHCSDCVMGKPKSGISAAVEVVKKMV